MPLRALNNYPSSTSARSNHRIGYSLSLRLHLRSYSTPSSLITTKNIPAPHTGHIRILTLNSPDNKNAISWQLLSELGTEINRIKSQTDGEWTRFLAHQKRKSGNAQKHEATDAVLGTSLRHEHQFDEEDPPTVGEGCRALIIGSDVNGVFCAGADLKERKSMSAEEYAPALSLSGWFLVVTAL